MKKSILITGLTGSGKTTISNRLRDLGNEVYGIEDMEGMFSMYRKGTHDIFNDFDNANPEHIQNSEWICHVEKLKQLIEKQKSDFAFYCGTASNMDDILPLFDKIILLKPGLEEHSKRLSDRKGTKYMGNTEESREVILGWKDWWENEMEKKGVISIDADGNPDDVAKKIIDSSL